jgi:8-oxo-dGTP pyrophosphatase MutT (NUDIX family)
MITKQIKVNISQLDGSEEKIENIIFNNTHNKCIMSEDKEYWISRSVATAGVVITKHKGEYYILLGKRGKGAADFQGYWNLPCGYLDYDESGYECFVREVYEESGFFVPDITKKNIIKDYTKEPYFVQTDVKSNRQNVTLYYGIVFKTKRKEKLPTLTLKYTEKDEVEYTFWANINKIFMEYSFAFNHDEKIKNFLKMFKKDMKWYRRFLRFIKVI